MRSQKAGAHRVPLDAATSLFHTWHPAGITDVLTITMAPDAMHFVLIGRSPAPLLLPVPPGKVCNGSS